jgi:hypothetical protein
MITIDPQRRARANWYRSWSRDANFFNDDEILQTEDTIKQQSASAFDPILVDFALFKRSHEESRRR